jgi:hypothetical protein
MLNERIIHLHSLITRKTESCDDNDVVEKIDFNAINSPVYSARVLFLR